MPHKPANKKPATNPATKDFGVKFIQVKLSPEDRDRIKKEMSLAPDSIVEGLERVLTQGIKVSFSYGERNDAIICTFTGSVTDAAGGSSKLAYSSFGPNACIAFASSLWKHVVMFDSDTHNWSEQLDSDDWG